ncbi:hypothetical protein AMATHDRAFT_1763 [Amanita thiersii Skay4041]|uniref:UBC core domain-containing protein n=1 Tax=Amanita thiersii Skay4041 TaxID=703135 RepID=A0A2A9NTN0_9AGAR|nr:hypothetical protein AMATHDRAFT_1763 [Amanita thiersii Skay4041]
MSNTHRPVDPSPSSLALATVSMQYASLHHSSHCPLGMYIVPSAHSLMCWDAVFFVHRGHYAGAILKLRLNFPGDYPNRPPTIQFVTDIFHPLIATDGKFNLSARFRPWRPQEHTVFHVLAFVKLSFSTVGLNKLKEADCVNQEAYKFHKTPTSFDALAKQSAMLSQSDSALFDSDHPSLAGKVLDGITFRDMSQDQQRLVRKTLGLQEWGDVSI